MTDCFKYGSNNGCDINCPVLQSGDCTEPGENILLIRQLKINNIIKKIKK